MHRALCSSTLFALVLACAACDGSKAQPLDPPMTFTLDNNLGAAVFIEQLACSGGDSWLTLRDSEGTVLSLETDSCITECGEEPKLCAPRAQDLAEAPDPAACLPPMVRELQAGGELERTWTGIFGQWNGLERCTELVAARGEFEATACWGEGTTDEGRTLSGRKCKSLTFTVEAGSDVRINTQE